MEVWKLAGYRCRHHYEVIFGMDHVTREPTAQQQRKQQRDIDCATEHRKHHDEVSEPIGHVARVDTGGDVSVEWSPSTSTVSGHGRFSSSYTPSTHDCHLALIPADSESNFLCGASVSAVTAGKDKPRFVIPKLPAARRLGSRTAPSLLSLSVTPPAYAGLGHGHGHCKWAPFQSPLSKTRALTMERPDGTSYVPEPIPAPQSQVTGTAKWSTPHPASSYPGALPRCPLLDVEVCLELFTAELTRGCSAATNVVVAGGSDSGSGSGVRQQG